MTKAIALGTYDKVQVEAPFATKNKAQLVKVGLDLKVPYELTWSCYEGGDKLAALAVPASIALRLLN